MAQSGELQWDRRFRVRAPLGSFVGPASLAQALARLENLPFVVQMSLPVVKLPDGRIISAFQGVDAGVSATFYQELSS